MVFDKGELKESGKPNDLLKDPYSMFADMARHAPGLRDVAETHSDDDEEEEESPTSSGIGASTDASERIIVNGL